MTISTIVLAITCVLRGGGGGGGGSPPKDKGVLNKWLNRLAHAFKTLAGRTVEAFLALVGSVVGAILGFFWQGFWICC